MDRDAKVEQVLYAAEAIARTRGLRELSIADVARSLGLSANSVYWYFPSRDDLWIAVVERIGATAFAAKPRASPSWDRQVLWLVDRLAELYPMVALLQDHARQSTRLAAYHRQLRDRIQAHLAAAITQHAPEVANPDEEALAILAIVVGCYALEVPPPQRSELVARALRRLGS